MDPFKMTPDELRMHHINYYLTLPKFAQDEELVAIYTEYKSNLIRIKELDDRLQKAKMRLLMSDMPTANNQPA